MIIEENVYSIVETNLNFLTRKVSHTVKTLQTFVEKLTVYHKMSVLNCLLSPFVQISRFLLNYLQYKATKSANYFFPFVFFVNFLVVTDNFGRKCYFIF